MPNSPFYEEGAHVGEVTAQGFKKASTGTMQFVLRVKVLGLPDGDNYIPHRQQYERTVYLSLTEKAAPFAIETIKFLGFDGSSFAELDPDTAGHHSFVGQQVNLWCKHQADQNGGLQEKWSVSRGAMPLQTEPLDRKDLRRLDALFGAALKPKAKARPAGKQAETPDALGLDDDDIPF